MAKSKTQDQRTDRAVGSRFSRRRIIMAAAALVLLVGLSWVTLGLMKKGPEEPAAPKEPVVTKLTIPITLPDSGETPSQPAPEQPESTLPAPVKPEQPQPAPEQPKTGETPTKPVSEKPVAETASGPVPAPGTDAFVLPQPKAPSLEEQTRVLNEMAENGKPATTPETPEVTGQEKPAAEKTPSPPPESQPKPSAETPSVPTGPDVQAKVPFQVLDQAKIPSSTPPVAETPTMTAPKTPAAAPDISTGTGFPAPAETPSAEAPAAETPSTETPPAATPAFPPPETGEEKMVAELPRPKWQTMDKNWEKVEIEEAPPVEALKARDSNWRQMEVGQEETAKTESETPLPGVVKEEPPAEEAASATGEKPGDTVESKTHQPVVKKSTKATAKSTKSTKSTKPTKSTKSTQTAKRPASATTGSGSPRLTIINETGRPGQGQVYRDVLAAMGYRVNKIEDRPARSGPTTIMYGPGLRNQAVNLARRLPGKRSVAPTQNSSSNEIVIVIR